jgi:hypothetical protein
MKSVINSLAKPTVVAVLFSAVLSPLTIAMAAEIAGKTIISRGGVYATEIGSTSERKLKRRSPIYGVDVVKTDANSKTQLRMTDGGMIALKENSELVISQYEYDAKAQKGSVAMELLKGGLRSVTGAIKAEKGNYQLSTPVGSIGIRGTHYEIELIGGELFIAVWDGAIDVSVEVGAGDQSVSLGDSEDYSYASVDEEGIITPMLAPPANFQQGHSSDPAVDAEQPADDGGEGEGDGGGDGGGGDGSGGDGSGGDGSGGDGSGGDGSGGDGSGGDGSGGDGSGGDGSGGDGSGGDDGGGGGDGSSGPAPAPEPPPEVPPETGGSNGGGGTEVAGGGTGTGTGNDPVEIPPEDLTEFVPAPNIAELILAKTGTVAFTQVESFNVTSSGGAISNFQASMSINFDNATVPVGELSFDDSGGGWFAAFNGIINVDKFELGINFASHGNNRADGTITAEFTNGGIDNILSNFDLFEINVSGTAATAGGQFAIK